MTQQPATKTRQRPPDAVYKLLNPTFKALLRSPLHGLMSKRLLVLSYTGRKTNKAYSIPVGYVQRADAVYITTNSGWKNNFRGGAPVKLRLSGRERSGKATLIDDLAGLAAAYRDMLAENPQLSQIIGLSLDPNGEPNAAELASARERGYVVVQVQLY